MLAAFCASGTELYISAAGSAATQQQLSEACPSDTALTLPVPQDSDGVPGAAGIVDGIASNMPFVEPARHGGIAYVEAPNASGATAKLILVQWDGLTNGDSPMPNLASGQVALTRTNADQLGAEVGTVLTTTFLPLWTVDAPSRGTASGPDLTVAYVIPDVATDPVPTVWCGLSWLVAHSPAGDAPPVSAIVARDTLALFENAYFEVREVQVVHRPLTLAELRATIDGYSNAIATWGESFGSDLPSTESLGLRQVERRATGVATTVDRSLQPVRLTSLVAIGGVLLASAVLLARERRRELRLLGVRGVSPLRVALRMLPAIAITASTAAVAGCGLAWGVVVAFAPSGLLVPAALARAWLLAAVVAFASVVAVVAAVAVVADHAVDRTARRSLVRFAPPAVVAALVALALVAYRKLKDDGGIRAFGVEVRGGELLALGFPFFALLAGTVVAASALGALVWLARGTGARLPRAMRLGWRRVVLEVGPTVAVIVAVSLAAGSFVAASALSDGARRQLVDKAAVYVGSDMSIAVFDEPDIDADLAARSTTVVTVRGKIDGTAVDLYGVDPVAFPSVATLRSDASSRTLPELVALLSRQGATPAALAVGSDLAIGDTLSITLAGSKQPLVVEIVGTAAFFPGRTTGTTQFVMLDEVVEAAAAAVAQHQLLVRDPPANLVQSLRDQGVRVGVVLDAATTFDASSFSGLRWAYLPLRVLGMLFALVAAAAQFLVVAARRVPRRAAHAIQQRTGFGRRSLWVAAITEAIVPLAVGATLGWGVGLWAVRLSIPLLDPMPLLAPRAAFSMPWATTFGILLAVPLWAAVTAAVIVRSTTSGDPMKALRGEQ